MLQELLKRVGIKNTIVAHAPTTISQSLYPQEVLEIHNEFDTAADKLLEEAKSVLKEAETKDIQKIGRLEALGFKQTKQVVELKPFIAKAELSKEQVELVNYYKREYPFNKFITEEQVKEICHKYNLVCGDVNRFTGFVPEKNLKEIESFKLKDTEKDSVLIEVFKDWKSIGVYSGQNVEIKQSTHGYSHLYNKNNPSGWSFQQSDSELIRNGEFYGNDYENLFGLQSQGHLRIRILNNKLKICAPIKDMDISGLELTEGYKLQKKHIPDPVVLQPVKGGYLCLAKWGQEANDPILANELDN